MQISVNDPLAMKVGKAFSCLLNLDRDGEVKGREGEVYHQPSCEFGKDICQDVASMPLPSHYSSREKRDRCGQGNFGGRSLKREESLYA